MSELSETIKEYGLGSPRAKAMLVGTARDIMKRIDANMRRLGVSPYGEYKGSGNLKRSVHWTVYNATGGDEAVIQFYMQNITSFVELAVQGMRDRRTGRYVKGWRVANGGLPPAMTSSNFGPINVSRTSTSGGVLKRKAKPFLTGEMRVHGRMLFDRLVKDYGYIGNMLLVSSMVPNISGYVHNADGSYRAQGGKLLKTPIRELVGNDRNSNRRMITHQMDIGEVRWILRHSGFDVADFE